jgi:hypothetical protein
MPKILQNVNNERKMGDFLKHQNNLTFLKRKKCASIREEISIEPKMILFIWHGSSKIVVAH